MARRLAAGNKTSAARTLRVREASLKGSPQTVYGTAAPPDDALLALPTAFGSTCANEARVGPFSPRGSMLGPERRNTFSGAVPAGKSTPMKQLLISSQFWGPQTTFFVASGLKRFAGELSKWVISCSLAPLGSAIGSAY